MDADLKARLDLLAGATRRSTSFLAVEAIRQYVDDTALQIAEVQAALREADVGDFASDDAVATMRRKWTEDAP